MLANGWVPAVDDGVQNLTIFLQAQAFAEGLVIKIVVSPFISVTRPS
jgi:hypothetical protein